MKKTTAIKLYVYNLDSGENYGSGGFVYEKSKVGIVSTSDELTVSILEKEYNYGNFWGDVNHFQMRDDDGGHKNLQLGTTIDLSEETFMKIFGKKDVWDFFSQNQEVMKFSDLSFNVGDLMEEIDETMGLDINLNTDTEQPVKIVFDSSDF